MKAAGFVPVALLAGDNIPGRIFVVSNAVFIGEKHPLYSRYASTTPQFPMVDRSLSFLNRIYFLNEDQPARKHVFTARDILQTVLDLIEPLGGVRPMSQSRRSEVEDSETTTLTRMMNSILTSAHLRDVNRLRRVSQLESPPSPNREKVVDSWVNSRAGSERMHTDVEVEILRREIETLRSSRSWKATAPLRSVGRWVRQRLSFVVRLVRWLRS
jgi:hypothetical protein